MRPLQAKDLGLFSKVISNLEIREEVRDLFRIAPGGTPEEIEVFNNQTYASATIILLENYWKAEADFHKLISSLTGKSKKEVEELSLSELFDIIKEIGKDKSFLPFLNLVAQ